MKRFLHLFGRLLVLAIFIGAAWLLYERLKHFTLQEIGDALARIPSWHIAIAALLTVANYGILVGYDWFAVRWVVGEKLPIKKISVAAFTGYAFSYNFGATLFGTSIRYRLYSAWGVSLVQILELLVILGLTFWFGVFALAGVVFIVSPLQIPPPVLDGFRQTFHCNLPFDDTFWLGVVLLLIALGYVLISILFRKPFRLFGHQVPIPPPKLTMYQIAIACGDLLVAAAVMDWLLPPLEGAYVRVLGAFMLAFVAAVLSHVPGGYGVFEGVFLFFFPEEAAPAVFAAIIVFRIIYYWIPLLLAAVMLGYHELTLRNDTTPETER
jgi:phosphatidylglycerol lysyltransferase